MFLEIASSNSLSILIRCPFHGWTFEGKTGKCVHSENYDTKVVDNFQYLDITTMNKNKEGQYIE